MSTTEPTTETIVFKHRIDSKALAKEQVDLLDRHAGAHRAAYNWALGLRNLYEDKIREVMRAESTDEEVWKDKAWRKAARKRAETVVGKPSLFSAFSLGSLFSLTANVARDPEASAAKFPEWLVQAAVTPRSEDAPIPFHWWGTEKHGVNRFAIASAFDSLNKAFDVYYRTAQQPRTPKKPRKDGRPDGWPRFKRFGDADGFAIFNIYGKSDTLEKFLPGGRKVRVPSIGTIRLHGGTKRLRKALKLGGIPKSARFTRDAGYWYVAFNVTMQIVEARTTRKQHQRGMVAVDLGVNPLATFSDGTVIVNDRIGRKAAKRIEKAAQRLSRTPIPKPGQPTSEGRKKARKELSKRHHQSALQRESRAHQITKRLATQYESVALESLDLKGLGEGKPDAIPDPKNPGQFLPNGAELESLFKRELRDAAPGMIIRQMEYKSKRYGSKLIKVDRYEATNLTCSQCGELQDKEESRKPIFLCVHCGNKIPRGRNSAQNIARLARADQKTEEE